MTAQATEQKPNPAEQFAEQLAAILGSPWHIERDSVEATRPCCTPGLRYACNLIEDPERADGNHSARGLMVFLMSEHPEFVHVRAYGARHEDHPHTLWRTCDPVGTAEIVQEMIIPICRAHWDAQRDAEQRHDEAAAARATWREELRAQVEGFGEPYPDEEDDEVIVMPLHLDRETVCLLHNTDGEITIHAEVTADFAARVAHALSAMAHGAQ